jgi:hypothetical protein
VGLLLAGGDAARWRSRAELFAGGAAPGCSLDNGPPGWPPGWPLEEGLPGWPLDEEPPDQPRPHALHEAGGGASPTARKDGSGVGRSWI